jgi:hypothetical protein
MKFNTSATLKASLFGIAMSIVSIAVSAATPGNATPFGLEIGVASCDAARAKLGHADESKLGGTDVLLTATNPSALYEGASKAVVRCSNGHVAAVQFEASKGGMANEGSRDVYSGLSKKYKLIAGGPMPQLGNGYARFQSGNSIIEQSAPHLSFEFTVTYYEKGFYDSVVASNKADEKKSQANKQSSL